MKSPLIEALLNPDTYPHKVDNIQLKETHISWVILTGEFAYKIKKPVDFKFLDYTRLEQRNHFCREELRLNHRLAPTLYLEVVPIYGSPEHPRFNGPGEIIEYAVKMRQFDGHEQFDTALADGRLADQDADKVAVILANFHQHAEPVEKTKPYGTPDQIYDPVKQNFDQMLPLIDNPLITSKLLAIAAWSESEHAHLKLVFEKRRADKKIRECHGDFHLANITRFQDKVTIFDCIEFNEPFRYTDTMADVGFLMMDLLDKHHPDIAYRFLSSYMEQSGDYEGLLVLHYYTVYRAMVRTKINLLRRQQEQEGSEEYLACNQRIDDLISLSIKLTEAPLKQIILMHGFSGSGKTHLSNELLHLGFIRLRSDILRKKMSNLPAEEMTSNTPGEGLYSHAMNVRTYHALAKKARIILNSGFPVIIDATFLKREQRDVFAQLGGECGAPWLIVDCRASHKQLVQRINERLTTDSTSDATVDVLKFQENNRDALTPIEQKHVIIYEHEDAESVLNQIHNYMFMQARLIE